MEASVDVPFTDRQFRNALGLFATGVVIVTATAQSERLGMTISSFNAVSLTPPLILFSIARTAHRLAQWQAARRYGVTILAENQTGLSNRFARPGGNKWDGIADLRMSNGAPLLPDYLLYFECDQHARYEGGDHDIFVGRVTRFASQPQLANPLLFFGGRYRVLESDNFVTTPASFDASLHGW